MADMATLRAYAVDRLDVAGDDHRITVHGLAFLLNRTVPSVRTLLSQRGVVPDAFDVVRLGALRRAGILTGEQP